MSLTPLLNPIVSERPGPSQSQRSTCAIKHVDLKVVRINAFNIPQVNEDGIIIYNEMLESNHVRELFLKFVPVPIAAIPAPQVGQNAWFHFFFPNWQLESSSYDPLLNLKCSLSEKLRGELVHIKLRIRKSTRTQRDILAESKCYSCILPTL